MNYDELTQQVKALEKEQKEIERSIEAKIRRRDKKIIDLKLQYIEEHQPLALKRFQRIKVRARVTEASRKMLTDEASKEKRYALGATYTLIGVFNGYFINDNGEVAPCFYGKGDYRGRYDEILSVELTENQPVGNCNKCLKAKDGHCYMMGGKGMGPKYAVWKIEEDKMVPCPKYEEVVEGGLYGIKNLIYPARYYPKVTKVRTEDGKWKYRLYEGNGSYYTEHKEVEIETATLTNHKTTKRRTDRMERPKRMSSREAMRWNEDVERRRREYHEHRCAEDALYRRAYERQQEDRRRIQRQACEALTQLADAMHTDCMQRANSMTEDACCQPVKTYEEVMLEQALMDRMSMNPTEWFAHGTGFGLGFAVVAMMFADHGKMQQRMKEMEEERPYLKEINRIDAQFDKEVIRMSGFEW